jgi:hypothetical protein
MQKLIAAHNDVVRRTLGSNQRNMVILTRGVNEASDKDVVLDAVRKFEDFAHDHDHEHDFGAVTVNHNKYFFKVDYFDKHFEYGADPYEGPVNRVLTIMRAEEY